MKICHLLLNVLMILLYRSRRKSWGRLEKGTDGKVKQKIVNERWWNLIIYSMRKKQNWKDIMFNWKVWLKLRLSKRLLSINFQVMNDLIELILYKIKGKLYFTINPKKHILLIRILIPRIHILDYPLQQNDFHCEIYLAPDIINAIYKCKRSLQLKWWALGSSRAIFRIFTEGNSSLPSFQYRISKCINWCMIRVDPKLDREFRWKSKDHKQSS